MGLSPRAPFPPHPTGGRGPKTPTIATFRLEGTPYAVKAAASGSLFAEGPTGPRLPLEPVVGRMGFRRLLGAYRLLTPAGDHLRLAGGPVWVHLFGDLAEGVVGESPLMPSEQEPA